MRRAFVLVALGALALPAGALAHATLREASPGYRERLDSPPALVSLHFDQAVTALPTSIQVLNDDGKLVSGTTRQGADRRDLLAQLRRLPKGAYTVRWQAIASDGHFASGVFTFGVGVAAPPPTEAFGATGPTTQEHVVRWGFFLALALLLGGLSVRLLCLPAGIPAQAELRLYRLSAVGAVAVLEVGIVAFLLRAEDALRLPFARFLYGDLSPIASGTRFGEAFIAMTLGFAFTAGLLVLSWLFERRALLWASLAVALAFSSGLSVSGHQAAEPGSAWYTQLADWIHLTAATIWIGGLVALAVAVWPAAPAVRREAFLRFSLLATALVALVAGTGIYLAVLRLPHLSDLWTTHYGRLLFVKMGLASVALAWGGFHRTVVKPWIERGGPRRALGLVPRSLLGESAAGMAVLPAAAVLVDSRPPAPQPSPAEAAAVYSSSGVPYSGSQRERSGSIGSSFSSTDLSRISAALSRSRPSLPSPVGTNGHQVPVLKP